LTPDKFLVHEFLPRGNDPSRGGLIRPLGWLYAFKNFTFKGLVRYIEKFGIPFIMARMNASDPEVFEKEAAKLLTVIQNFGDDGGGLFSDQMEMEFIDGSSNAGEAFYKFIDLCERAIQKIILGQTSSSDSRNSNRSTAEVHDLVRHDLSAYDATLVKATIDQQLLPLMVKFKYGENAPVPQIEFAVKSNTETLNFMEIIKIASEAGYELEDVNELSRRSGLKFQAKATPAPLENPIEEPEADTEEDPETPEIEEPEADPEENTDD